VEASETPDEERKEQAIAHDYYRGDRVGDDFDPYVVRVIIADWSRNCDAPKKKVSEEFELQTSLGTEHSQ
jgi:hypothetical protein